MSKYKLIIFDVDGTLLDTTEGVIEAVKFVIKKNSLKALAEEQLRTFIGPPIQKSFETHYSLTKERAQELANDFRNRYKSEDLFKATPYEGVYDLMEQLMKLGYIIAIATYKRHDYAIDILKHFKFHKYTSIMYGADHFNKLTKKDIILKCIEDTSIMSYEEVLMVGDTDNDAIGAKELGIDFIGVTYGFGFKNSEMVKYYGAVGSAKNPGEILNFL